MTFKDRLLLAIRAIGADIKAHTASLANKVDKVSGKGLSTNDYTTVEKNKLASLDGPHFRGTFASFAALQSGVATPVPGNYADVDTTGTDAIRYIWDSTDSKWVFAGASGSLTAAQVKALYESNPDTAPFTPSEKTKLASAASIVDSYKSSSTVYSSDKVAAEIQNLTNTISPIVEGLYGDIGNLQGSLDQKVDKILGRGLSQENFSTVEKTKLAGLESPHFRGTFTSLYRLEQGVPTGNAGDYADVDEAGTDAIRYIWDNSDNKWIAGGTATPLTAAQIKDLYESNDNTEAFTPFDKADLAAVKAGLVERPIIDDSNPFTNKVYSSQNIETIFAQILEDTAQQITDTWNDTLALLNQKVDLIPGKGLSTNDYTLAEQVKLGTMSATGQTSITAAATMNIGASPTESIVIPGKAGTTAITAFDVAPVGVIRYLYNIGVGQKVLTHNATSLILPAAANITLTNTSSAIMYSLGGGNWACIGVNLSSGLPIVGWAGGTVTQPINECTIQSKQLSSSAYDLSTVFSNTISITSGVVATITSLGTLPSGTKRTLVNLTGGTITFTNSSALILPQGVDMYLGYLDVVDVVSDGAGNWRVVNLQSNSGVSYFLRVGIGIAQSAWPTARLEIGADTGIASNPARAHIKLKPQAPSTTPSEGELEYGNDGKLYWVNNLRRGILGSPGFDRVAVNAAATGNVTLNLGSYTAFDLTLTGNTTLDFSSVPSLAAGEMFSFVVRLTCGATPYTISWPAGVISTWLNTGGTAGVAPAANKMVEFVLSTQNGTTAIARKAAYN